MKFESELRKNYYEKSRVELQKELGLANAMAVPILEKIVINSGLGEAKNNSDIIDQMVGDMTAITGQRPIVTKAKLSVSNFKIRKGMPIGVKVTLRGQYMWFFLEKLIHIVLPRIKDFNGISVKAFDGRGNYCLGLKDQLVFPEIDTTKVTRPLGLQIVINTTANSDEQGLIFLKKLGMPFHE